MNEVVKCVCCGVNVYTKNMTHYTVNGEIVCSYTCAISHKNDGYLWLYNIEKHEADNGFRKATEEG